MGSVELAALSRVRPYAGRTGVQAEGCYVRRTDLPTGTARPETSFATDNKHVIGTYFSGFHIPTEPTHRWQTLGPGAVCLASLEAP